MRRLLATVVFVCVSPAFVLAAGPRRGPAIPSWFWGSWQIVSVLQPYEPYAPAGAVTSEVSSALVGRTFTLKPHCASLAATGTDRTMPDGRVLVRDPEYSAVVQRSNERGYGEWGYFPLRNLGIAGTSAVEVTVMSRPRSVPLRVALVGIDVYLRGGALVVEVEGSYLLARKALKAMPCACSAIPGGKRSLVKGIPPRRPWWRKPSLPDAVRNQIAAIWRCKNAGCAARRLAALPRRESTGESVYFATLLRLKRHDHAAAIGLLRSMPEDGAGWTRLALLPERLYTHVNLTFAVAVARYPKYLPRFLHYGALFSDNLYPVLAAAVCRRDPAAFRRAVATLSGPNRDYISESRVNPRTCQPIPFHLANPELRPPPGMGGPPGSRDGAGGGRGQADHRRRLFESPNH